jgi:hypothetical protein
MRVTLNQALHPAVLGASPEVATLAVMYLRVRCCACPAFLLYNVGTGNFRGRKDTRTPLLAYVTTNSMCVPLAARSPPPQPSPAAPAFSVPPVSCPCQWMHTD